MVCHPPYRCLLSLTCLPSNPPRPITGTLSLSPSDSEDAYLTFSVHYELHDTPAILTVHRPLDHPSNLSTDPSDSILSTLLLSGLHHLPRYFPFVSRVSLPPLTHTTSLLYFLRHQTTWYEATLHACLHPPALMDTYRATHRRFLESPLESFDVFCLRYALSLPLQHALQSIYEASRTTAELFRRMFDHYGATMTHLLLHDWIETYVRDTQMEPFLRHHTWSVVLH